MLALWIILGILGVLLLAFIVIYNGLVRLRNQVKNAWAQIDVQLKRRYDLIPNLMETVKGYMKHERETMEAVTNARNLAQKLSGASVGARSKAETELSSALGRLLAVVENYPDLKANQNFLALQEELTGTENKIAYARQAYNDSVLVLNTLVQQFPANIIAGLGGFTQQEYFEMEEAAREPVQVKF